jgi:hypothetical protein
VAERELSPQVLVSKLISAQDTYMKEMQHLASTNARVGREPRELEILSRLCRQCEDAAAKMTAVCAKPGGSHGHGALGHRGETQRQAERTIRKPQTFVQNRKRLPAGPGVNAGAARRSSPDEGVLASKVLSQELQEVKASKDKELSLLNRQLALSKAETLRVTAELERNLQQDLSKLSRAKQSIRKQQQQRAGCVGDMQQLKARLQAVERDLVLEREQRTTAERTAEAAQAAVAALRQRRQTAVEQRSQQLAGEAGGGEEHVVELRDRLTDIEQQLYVERLANKRSEPSIVSQHIRSGGGGGAERQVLELRSALLRQEAEHATEHAVQKQQLETYVERYQDTVEEFSAAKRQVAEQDAELARCRQTEDAMLSHTEAVEDKLRLVAEHLRLSTARVVVLQRAERALRDDKWTATAIDILRQGDYMLKYNSKSMKVSPVWVSVDLAGRQMQWGKKKGHVRSTAAIADIVAVRRAIHFTSTPETSIGRNNLSKCRKACSLTRPPCNHPQSHFQRPVVPCAMHFRHPRIF